MKSINGVTFKGMILSGSCNLNNRKNEIDALNVFPVPDGDTGTNMSMTFSNGIDEVVKSGSTDLGTIAKTLSRGLLMGARGNSGVILSQIFRGFYQSIEGKSEITVDELAKAMFKGAKVAYKAVMRPVEGTILTVVRESTEYGNFYVEEHPDCSVEEYFEYLCKEARASLDRTPDLLPVLKEVGVVDSGGQGLLTVFEGFKAFLDGNPYELSEPTSSVMSAALDVENDGFGYCTEFIIRLSQQGKNIFKEEKLRKALSQLGESIVVVQDDDLVKVHVHTLTPGDALNLAQRYGEFVKLKIENMQEQHNTILSEDSVKTEAPKEEKEYAIIAVAAGDGLTNLFKEYRVDEVISGGQTMNPATEDFVTAINKLNAKHIFILPNNSNIILAAEQASQVIEDKDIRVLQTKSVPQGLSACVMFNPDVDVETNLQEMNDAIAHVKTGQVTYAIKDTTFDGIEIHEGNYMGIFDKQIVISTENRLEATMKLLEKMMDEESEIVTLITGEDAVQEETDSISTFLEETYDVEVDVQNGGQPVYSYIIGVE